MAASQASDPMLAPQFLVLGHYFHENALLRLGKYHAYAFLSEIEEHALPYTRIAGFLKHGYDLKPDDSFLVWFFWPGKGFLTLASLTPTSPSSIWTLDKQFELDPPTKLAGEFVQLTHKPSIFFIRWPETNESDSMDDDSSPTILNKEFGSISAAAILQNMITLFLSYLESKTIPGNSFHARNLALWHVEMQTLAESLEKGGTEYGVHPMELATGLIGHLTDYLAVFKLRHPDTSGDTLIPMALILQWRDGIPSGDAFQMFLKSVYNYSIPVQQDEVGG